MYTVTGTKKDSEQRLNGQPIEMRKKREKSGGKIIRIKYQKLVDLLAEKLKKSASVAGSATQSNYLGRTELEC